MLLYENIYGNIYYSYAAAGQVMDSLTLMDIEEAFPIPMLLRYAREWKTPSDAYSTIIQMI